MRRNMIIDVFSGARYNRDSLYHNQIVMLYKYIYKSANISDSIKFKKNWHVYCRGNYKNCKTC